MKKIALFSMVFSSLAYVSCAQGTSESVETKAPNSDYKSAFPGQTRIGAVKTQTPYEFKVLSEGLTFPWGVKSLPDGRLIITEKAGNLRIAKPDGELSKPIMGLPAVNTSGQGGLLGITIDPNFDKNRMVYWTFAENVDGGTLTSVAKGKLSADETKIEGFIVLRQLTKEISTTVVGFCLIKKAICLLVRASAQTWLRALKPSN